MALMDYVKQNLPALSSVLNDTDEVETYQCPSYYDDDNVLQDCECGLCK